ncbi:MAG: VOC family protein [Acidimicrobiia bacterium]
MSEVKALGYLGFHATELDVWRRWATEVLGMQVVAPSPGSDLLLRMDERGWRVSVEEAEAGGLAFVGWEVADEAALCALQGRLQSAGVSVHEDPRSAALRRVERLITCRDPDGFVLEFFVGAHVPEQPFVSPTGVTFVTGAMGLGHILLNVADEAATKRFYLDLLGFRMSDYIRFEQYKVHFTHVNQRHHSLAFVEVADRPPSLGHFMVEVDTIDDVGRALDRVNAGAGVLTETFGRHSNDHMLSFYMMNPSGSQAEYGYGGRLIDSEWRVVNYDVTAYWGHKVPGSEYSMDGPASPRGTAKDRVER